MPEESKANERRPFVSCVEPWVLAGGLGLVYLLTLNAWFSAESLGTVARACGWNWRPELFAPLTWLVTYPCRWLPAQWTPLLLNLLAALCAALSLACLARSVALLPQDRTDYQRQRLGATVWLAGVRGGWVPPLVAVLLCGLQFNFWRHATAATGEMLDLLLFAYLVRCVLELNAAGGNRWLLRLAFVYGLAVANNWAMVAYGPLFLLATIWAKKLWFLSRTFLLRLLSKRLTLDLRLLVWVPACFLAGFSLFLLLPLVAAHSSPGQISFWHELGLMLRAYKAWILSAPRSMVLVLFLTAVAPAMLSVIRWPDFTSGMHPLGDVVVREMFHAVHVALLVLAVWLALDGPFSPRALGLRVPCLPLYYLGALSAGYFCGYVLVAFGTASPWRNRPFGLPRRVLHAGLAGVVWLAPLWLPTLLVWKNLPELWAGRRGPLSGYATDLERSLPAPGAVILSDNSFRLACLQLAVADRRQSARYLAVDVGLLCQDPSYLEHLQRQHRQLDLGLPAGCASTDVTNSVVVARWLLKLALHREVYYLHPAFGHVGEFFHLEPRGPFYRLEPHRTKPGMPAELRPDVAEENRLFWGRVERERLPTLLPRLQPPAPAPQRSRLRRFLAEALPAAPAAPEPALVATYYSQGLDCWGAVLQKAGRLAEAGECFALARQLNPDNVAANINWQCNQDLQAARALPWRSPRELDAWLGKRHSWEQVLANDGPIDEPNCCNALGLMCARRSFYRQAFEQFQRVAVLAPAFTNAVLRLAEMDYVLGNYSNTVVEASRVLQLEPTNTGGLFLKGSSLVELRDYEHAIATLTELLALQSTNDAARARRAVARFQSGQLAAARQDYEALARTATVVYPIYATLAEVASRQKDTAAAIKYCELCLSNAPPNTPGLEKIRAQLKELRP